MMALKLLQPIGKQPKITTRCILLSLACAILLFRVVNSKSESTVHEGISRFFRDEGETPTIPVYGLAAQHRIFRVTGMAPAVVVTPARPEPMESNNTKEEILLASATRAVTPSFSDVVHASPISDVNIKENISTVKIPSGSKHTIMPSLLTQHLLAPSSLSIIHKQLESSIMTLKEMSVTALTPSIIDQTAPIVQTPISRFPESSYGGVTTTAELHPSPSVSLSSVQLWTSTWHDKRDTFWSIKPTTVKSWAGVNPTSAVRDEDIQSERVVETLSGNSYLVPSHSDPLIVPTASVNFSNSQELTTATVMFVSLSTERWNDEDVPLHPSSDSQVRKEEFSLPAGTVAGIVVASIGFVAIVAAVLGLFIFRRFHGLGVKTYENKFNGDNCSYLDSLQVSYINNHIELPKESSEEMFSLDNDSFLNSLEAMTMENYWAEDRRSTRV